ncbi:low molecular weight protein arginine phosphatase [soil metagenome]
MGAERSVLFVCTGNTCRSPLAEALCKVRLAERLGVSVKELASRGFVIRSGGVAASPGDAASEEAVSIAREFGADLTGHRSRPVNPEWLDTATDVIAMTGMHAFLLDRCFPGLGPPAELLCEQDDLPDPIGGDATLYRASARIIVHHVDRLITEWLE